MMRLSTEEIKKNPLTLLERIAAGEALTIVQADIPIAEVTPLTIRKRPFGLAKGQFSVPDDFDEPLPDEVMVLFEGR